MSQSLSSPGDLNAREPLPELVDTVKILLVDDQPENLLSAEAVLEGLGQEIVKAESGREALRHLLDQDFAVIVLDIMMPEMDGFETAALIRQRERSRHTPIIFLTALGRGEEHIRTGYDLGAVDYIMKPFVAEILRTKVSVFVELNRTAALLRQQSELLERRNDELQHAIERSWRAEEEIKALNQHLEQQVTELAEVNHELEAFSFTASHDLRGPLSRIAGFSKALLEFHAEQLDETGRRYLDRIEHSAARMCVLIEDLLRFSRITRVEMSEGKVDLTEIVRGLAAELAAQDSGRDVEFVIADGVEGWGDAALLRTALLNMMENAWKYTRKRAAARIEFGSLESVQGPAYYLRDNGAGFDMAEADRLFNPFQRLHKESDFEGTGIGLATVDRIIRRHGGQVWAQGEVGQGATFFFTLGREASR
jgi:two-component system sensor histidine kinase/response regulator